MAAFIKQVSFSQSNAPVLEEDIIGDSVSTIVVDSSWVFYIPVRRSGAERSKKDLIPHVSSMFFYEKLNDEIASSGIALMKGKWFTNLTSAENIGTAAIYVALAEFVRTNNIKSWDRILLLVPGSGRFSYGTVLLSVGHKCNV